MKFSNKMLIYTALIVLVISILEVIYSTYGVKFDSAEDVILEVFPSVLLILSATFILLSKKRNVLICLGLYGLSLGVEATFNGYENLDITLDVLGMIIAVLLFIAGLSLVVTSLFRLFGEKNGILLMTATVAILMGLDIFQILYDIHLDFPLDALLTYNIPSIPCITVCIIMLGMLYSEDIVKTTYIYRMEKAAHNSKTSLYADDYMFVSREDVHALDSWFKNSGNADDMFITLYYPSAMKRVLHFTKDSGKIIGRLLDNKDSFFMQGFNFTMEYFVPADNTFDDCDSVRIYGSDGFVMNIIVRNPDDQYAGSPLW